MQSGKWRYSVLGVGILLAGCVFVQPTTEGKKVRVLTAGEVDRCRSLGTLTSSVSAYIGAIPRARDAVQDDVTLNAQNAAAEMGADTIVPASTMEEGKQTFNIYRCLTP
jgi:uncharacterized protein DUF4156